MGEQGGVHRRSWVMFDNGVEAGHKGEVVCDGKAQRLMDSTSLEA